MKKIFLILALVFSVSFGVMAQRNDRFFNSDNDDIYYRFEDPENILSMPSNPIGSNANEPAPIGDGLIILTAIGIGYALKKSFFNTENYS